MTTMIAKGRTVRTRMKMLYELLGLRSLAVSYVMTMLLISLASNQNR